MRGLADKVAIVTGGANGIGRAIMERLCQEGVSVTFSGISEAGAATEQQCLARGYRVQFVHGDMAEEAFCRRLVRDALGRWDKINFLVNNAFSFLAKGLDASREDWLRVMSVGPIAYATMAQGVVDPMRQQGAARSSIFRAFRPTSPSPSAGPTTRPRGPSINLPAAWPWTFRRTTSA